MRDHVGRGLLRLGRGRGGQALIEYLLMTVMLLFVFTLMYRVLSGQLKMLFTKAGMAILYSYGWKEQ